MSSTRYHVYILYDQRAIHDTSEAHIYCTAETLKEARCNKREMFPDAVIYKDTVVNDVSVHEEFIE